MELRNEDGKIITNPQEGDVGYQGTAKFYYQGGEWLSESHVWMFPGA